MKFQSNDLDYNHILVDTSICVPLHTGTYTHTYMRTFIQTFIHFCVCPFISLFVHPPIQTSIHAYIMHTCTCICISYKTYIHTYTHRYKFYIHMNTCIPAWMLLNTFIHLNQYTHLHTEMHIT